MFKLYIIRSITDYCHKKSIQGIKHFWDILNSPLLPTTTIAMLPEPHRKNFWPVVLSFLIFLSSCSEHDRFDQSIWSWDSWGGLNDRAIRWQAILSHIKEKKIGNIRHLVNSSFLLLFYGCSPLPFD